MSTHDDVGIIVVDRRHDLVLNVARPDDNTQIQIVLIFRRHQC
jgi:hypothetical protein